MADEFFLGEEENMASIEVQDRNDDLGHPYNGNAILWEAVGDADTGNAKGIPGNVEVVLKGIGTFGGATLVVEASLNGGVDFEPIDDAFGSAMSYTANFYKPVGPLAPLIRVVTSGGAGTDIDVYMFFRNK